MSEQAKFQAWWDECGFNSVILRAAAWEAWMARAELNTTPAADTDPWVTQDRVPARVGIDEYRYASWTHEPDRWRPVNESGGWDDSANHGWVDDEGDTLLLRCRASQLPEVCEEKAQPAEDPDEWIEITDPDHVLRSCDQLTAAANVRLDHLVGEWPGCCPASELGVVGDKVSDSRLMRFRCRRRDLPKVEQPEHWPKYWTTCDATEFAYVEQVNESSAKVCSQRRITRCGSMGHG